jgi:hypothetical protein
MAETVSLEGENMVSTVQQPLSTASAPLLCRMLDKLTAFQALLIEEQDAIRSLSFGQFTSVTVRKNSPIG